VQHKRRQKKTRPAGNPRRCTPADLVARLLAWFAANARDLPWRRTRGPYAIWISEIMLQQTQVKTVIPYWERWMRELPTAQSLARARPEKVLKLWEGLGYYTRARNLQTAAQLITDKHGGSFPEEFDDVLALPGIGRYTAGAICSIAFNQPTPILDGNVIRVLTRLFGIGENPRETKTNARLWSLAASLVQSAARVKRRGRNCSHLNQALMELGATVCTPRQPKCPLCPVRKSCAAFREDRTGQLPNLGRRAIATERRFAAFVVERSGRFLVQQRPAGVVNAHLWEFPNLETNTRPTAGPQLAKTLFNERPEAVKPLRQIRHTITRYRITMDVFRVEFANGAPDAIPNARWCSPAQLHKLAFPSAHRNILGMLARQ